MTAMFTVRTAEGEDIPAPPGAAESLLAAAKAAHDRTRARHYAPTTEEN